MTLLTLVTVASLQTVGIILVVAMLITPAATAYLLTNRLSLMICWAAGLGLVSAFSGIYLSFTYNLASGATIVMTSTLLFIAALLLSPNQGLLWRGLQVRRRRHQSQSIAGTASEPVNPMIKSKVIP